MPICTGHREKRDGVDECTWIRIAGVEGVIIIIKQRVPMVVIPKVVDRLGLGTTVWLGEVWKPVTR